MLSDAVVLIIYLTFLLDFLVWPIPSEVSTVELIRTDKVPVKWDRWKLVIVHAFVLMLWLVPALISLLAIVENSYSHNFWVSWTGVVLAIIGRVITILGSLTVRRHGFSSVISDGIFSISRHPIVVGLHLCLAGLLLTVQQWLLLIPYLITLIYFHHKVRQEEILLMEKYGDEYHSYSQSTPRYLFIL